MGLIHGEEKQWRVQLCGCHLHEVCERSGGGIRGEEEPENPV